MSFDDQAEKGGEREDRLGPFEAVTASVVLPLSSDVRGGESDPRRPAGSAEWRQDGDEEEEEEEEGEGGRRISKILSEG